MGEEVDVGTFRGSGASRRSLWQRHERRLSIGLVWEMGRADQ